MHASKKESIEHDIELGRRLKGVCQQSGWKDIESYFSRRFIDALVKLRQNPADSKAGATLDVIEDLVGWIKTSVNFSEEQFKKYKDNVFGQAPSEG